MARSEPGTRAGYHAFTTLGTRWADNDIYAHMNNTIHYQLFDTAVNGFLIRKGLLDLQASETVFLVVETGCRYFGEIAFPDTVAAGIRVREIGGSSVCYEVGLFRNDDDGAAAEGHFIHVNVGRDSRRPTPISEEARRVLGAIMAPQGAA